MTMTWVLDAVGVYATTIGSLLVFLYLWKTPRDALIWQPPQGQAAYAKHRRLLIICSGLVATWHVFDYLVILVL